MTFHDIYKEIYIEQWKQSPQSISGWHCFVHRPVTKKIDHPHAGGPGKDESTSDVINQQKQETFCQKNESVFWASFSGSPSMFLPTFCECICLSFRSQATLAGFVSLFPTCWGCGCGPKVLKHQQNCIGRDWKSALPTANRPELEVSGLSKK